MKLHTKNKLSEPLLSLPSTATKLPTFPTPRFTQTPQMFESPRKNQNKLVTWENMFGNFLEYFRKKNQNNPKILSNRRKQDTIGVRDPLESVTPLDQINQFQIDPRLRNNFRQYLNVSYPILLIFQGTKSIQQLVSESNRTKTKFPPKKIKSSKKISSSQATNPERGKFKFLHLLGIEDDQIITKIRVQKRFDKLRKLIAKNMDLRQHRSNEKNVQQVQMIRNLYNTQSDHKNQILSKNLLSARVDGKRELEEAEYSQRGILRIRDYNPEAEDKNKTSKQIRSETQNLTQKTRQEVFMDGDNYIENLECQQFVNDQKSKRKMKLNILQNRNRAKQFLSPEFIEYDYLQNKKLSGEPYLKDIQLYSYLHGHFDDYVNLIFFYFLRLNFSIQIKIRTKNSKQSEKRNNLIMQQIFNQE